MNVGAKDFSPLHSKERRRWQGDAAGRKIFRPYEGAGTICRAEIQRVDLNGI
jgi:hypothetical protein